MTPFIGLKDALYIHFLAFDISLVMATCTSSKLRRKGTISSLWPEAIGSTHIPKKTLSYRWIIENASALQYIDPNGFKSPTFEVVSPGTKTVIEWQLVISNRDEPGLDTVEERPPTVNVHRVNSLSQPSAYSLFLQPSDIKAKVLISDCTFLILNSDTDHEANHSATAATRTIQYDSNSGLLFQVQPRIGINRFIKQDDYLDGHTLTLQVNATLFFLTDYSERIETCNDVLVPADSIREDLGRFFQGDLFADVTITCGGKEFKAHKVILASQSPVFKKMFEIERSGVIEVPDITPAVMFYLLSYLYTGTAPHVDTLARELLNVANQYELPRLLSICETTLMSNITANSVLKILILAESYQAKTLKKACLGFIKCNFAIIYELDSWKELKASATHQNLALEVLENNQQAYSIPSVPKKRRK